MAAPDKQWTAMYRILAQRWRIDKESNLPANAVINGAKIGIWSFVQRAKHQKGLLTQEQVKALHAIEFKFSKGKLAWDDSYEFLKNHVELGGAVNLKQNLVIDDVNIGEWVSRQRKLKKSGQLSEERIRKLDQIGFEWRWSEFGTAEKLALLQKIHAEGGEVNVHAATIVDGVNIGAWVSNQRTFYRKGLLPADRIAALEAIGFKWSMVPSRQSVQSQHLMALRRLHAQGVDINSLAKSQEKEEKKLFGWLCHEKDRYSKDKLTAKRIQSLENIGIVWNLKDLAWEKNFAILAKIHAAGGDINLGHKAVIDGVGIGLWINNQRQRFRKGILDSTRSFRLSALGLKWQLRRSPQKSPDATA